jgi:hypothetical protein
MGGILAQAHFQRLEALRRVRWVLQGEPGSISLLKRDLTGELVEFLSIDQGVAPFEEDADGRALPPQVLREIQVSELMIGDEDVMQTAGIQHGQNRYSIVAISPNEPGIFEPAGLRRFYRFWIAPLEKVQ